MSSSIGKLYGPEKNNFRAFKARVSALYAGVNIETTENFQMGVNNKEDSYISMFPLGQTPGFVTSDNQTLSESSAIAFYIASQNKENHKLLGNNDYELSKILQFVLFFETQFDPAMLSILLPILYNREYNKDVSQKSNDNLNKSLEYLNNILINSTFLVGERITLCDVVACCSLSFFYAHLTDEETRKKYKNLTRYYLTVANQPNFISILGEPKLGEKVSKYEPKAETPKAPVSTKESAPKESLADLDAPVKKPKSKLELLPPSNFNLEDWKRFYSNNDTRPTAMDYFWKNFDKEGYSIWKVDYKYNSELTLGFMSCNLIAGFFNRLERAHKYAFGSMVVLGKDNDNIISGYFVIRGQSIPEEVYDAADFESFDFKKIDDFESNNAVREDIAAFFAWDEIIDGKALIDGKVFK